MKRLYADDLTGASPDNVATGQLSTATYPNKYNLVVPPSAPFYRNGMEITDLDGNLLFEGQDYYLALYYADGAMASRAAIFGGIMLIGHTEVKYKVQAFGSAYSVPETDIGLFLVNPNMTEPRNLDWSTLLRWKIPVPEMGVPEDFEEAVQTDKIIAAVMQLRDLIGENGEALDTALENVITELAKVAVRIHEDDLYQHHRTPHEHKYTPELIGALRNDGTAVNALKIFGRTLAELSAIMVQSHVSQAVIDRLYDKAGGLLNGRLHVSGAGELSFVSQDGKKSFRANGQNLLIAADMGDLTYVVDPTKSARGKAIELNAGYNSLLIPSDGAGNTLRPIYNGAFIITEDTVDLYLFAPSKTTANPTFTPTPTLKASGAATSGAPLSFDALPPQATETVLGTFRLTSSTLLTSPGYALTQKAVTDLRDKLDAYVAETFTVNGKAFGVSQAVELTKSDIGLGNVDNVAAAAKVAHKAFRDALINKALKTHTHTAADLKNVPTASASLSGLTFLSTLLDDTAAKAVVPKVLYDLSLKIAEGEDEAKNVIPGWVAGSTYYGDFGFLPIPTAGRYDGSSQQMSSLQRSAVGREENGKYYVLRNATSGYAGSEMVLYWTADVAADGTLSNPTPTTVEYLPAGLKAIAPTVRLKYSVITGDAGAIFQGTDNNYYLVMFDGTMDMAKHVRVSKVMLQDYDKGTTNPISPSLFNTNEDRLVVTNGKVCVVKTAISQTDFFTLVWVIADALVGATPSVVMNVVSLTGKYPAGDAARFSTYGSNSNDPNTTNWWYVTLEGKARWDTISLITFNRRNLFVAGKGNKIRVRLHPRAAFRSATERLSDPQWTMSYVIDLDAKTAVLDDDYLPICADVSGLTFPNGVYSQTSPSFLYGYTLSLFGQGNKITAIGQSDSEDNAARYVLPEGELFDNARWNVSWNSQVGSNIPVLGPYASKYVLGMRGLVELGGSAKRVLLQERNTSSCVQIEYTTDTTYNVPGYDGWGPSNERTAISQTTYFSIAKLAQIYDGSKSYLNGASFNGAGSFPYRNVEGSTTLTADRVSLSAAQWNDVQAFLETKHPGWSGISANSKANWLSVFDLGGQNLCLLQVHFLGDKPGGGKIGNTYIYRIPVGFAGGALTLTLSGAVEAWKEENVSMSQTELNPVSEFCQMRLIKRNNGWILKTKTLTRMLATGGGWQEISYLFQITADMLTWEGTRIAFNPGNTEIDYVYLPDTDEVARIGNVLTGIYLGGTAYLSKSIALNTGSHNVILFGPQVAEGLILYITQDIFFFADAKSTTIPATDFPMLPNTTVYVHAELKSDGTAAYLSSPTKLPDTATRLYVGYIKSNENSITETDIRRASRLDNISALGQHIGNKFAHDYLPTGNVSKTDYRLMQNLALLDSVPTAVPTGKYIIDWFTHTSHAPSVVGDSARPDEMAYWEAPEPDYLECTFNTPSFVSLISKPVKDYRLNLLVTGKPGATDNDSGAVILATYGKYTNSVLTTHTLSLVFSGSIDTHLKLTGRTELVVDYQQATQRSIAVIDPTVDPVNWVSLFYHILIERVGNDFLIAFKSGAVGAGDHNTAVRKLRALLSDRWFGNGNTLDGYLTYSFNTDAVDVGFSTPLTRWGMGACSQQFMQFWPIAMPDMGGGIEGYASPYTADEAFAVSTKAVDVSSFVAGVATTGNWNTSDAYKLWPAAAVYATTNPVTNGAPAGTAALMPPGYAKANKAFRYVLMKQVKVVTGGTNNVTLRGHADDSIDVYINGVLKGTYGAGLNVQLTLPVGDVYVGFVVSEVPDASPCYLGWALQDTASGTWLAKSEAGDKFAWMDAAGKIYAPTSVRKVSYTELSDKGVRGVVVPFYDNVGQAADRCIPTIKTLGAVAGNGSQSGELLLPVTDGVSGGYQIINFSDTPLDN